jgi:hypothetical protein
MPFGLNNAPATFQRLMNDVLREYIGKICLVYLDDIIIYSKNIEEHKRHVKLILEKIREANLKLKPTKCQWFKDELTFLGHVINKNGVKPWDGNIKKIKEAPIPTNVTEVRRFLGLSQYYRNFIKDFSTIARPLYDLTKKENAFNWTTECQKALRTLKEKLTTEVMLAHPDFNKEFKVYTDASDTGLGAILAQDDAEGRERVVCYEARTLSPAEKNYPTTEKECLAVIWGMRKFKHFVGGWNITKIYTDHAALRTLMDHEDPSPRRARWMEELARYDFEIFHRPGTGASHQHATGNIPARPAPVSCRVCGGRRLRRVGRAVQK